MENQLLPIMDFEENIDYYMATEKLLYNFKKLEAIVSDASQYVDVEYHARSKSIVSAPQTGGAFDSRSEDEIIEEMKKARGKSYVRTKARYDEIASVVKEFERMEGFIVIRMYYFNEDVLGASRSGQRKYTFDEIVSELASIGIEKSERTLRNWRSRLVEDMAICLFGKDAAKSARHSVRFEKPTP